ncbi:MAG: hypothetical protein KF819_06885 [Labilithrix sp.]|nr:hypothetical protein [Labilithrix sp.]
MGIDVAMKEALASRPDAVALACMDTRSGLLLGLQLRGDEVERDDVEIAAFSAAQLCSAPPPPGADDELDVDDEACDESFVASARWVHAYARVPTRRDLVVVGLAPGDTNVALLRTWIRRIAEQVGPHA